jgi:hypothetical protein
MLGMPFLFDGFKNILSPQGFSVGNALFAVVDIFEDSRGRESPMENGQNFPNRWFPRIRDFPELRQYFPFSNFGRKTNSFGNPFPLSHPHSLKLFPLSNVFLSFIPSLELPPNIHLCLTLKLAIYNLNPVFPNTIRKVF